ncbi:hypothetical protein LCGC14_1959930, partial [marine sediment metagenome]
MSFVVGSAQFLLGWLGSHESAPAFSGPDREAVGAEQLALRPLPRAPLQTVRPGLGFGFDLAAFLP